MMHFLRNVLLGSFVIGGRSVTAGFSDPIRSDGRQRTDNFLGALILAGSFCIPEVTVYFGHKLFRGNRVTKVSSNSLNAFDSPNLAPLATMGVNTQFDYGNVWRPRDISPFNLHTNVDKNVSLLQIFPSITLETVKVYLQAPTQGVVLQTYGARNFPMNRNDLLEASRKAFGKFNYGTIDLKKDEKRVLVIYSGGTIGMSRGPNGSLVCSARMLEKTVRRFPHMHDEEYAKERYGEDAPNAPLCLPEMDGEKFRVSYTIYEYEDLLDSTNMQIDDWIRIAQDVKNNYENFDGFVILHGTDTMSYTASALSFMMEHLGKAVVITGSQIPLFESRSDGRDNFLGALILAGNYCIPEVTVYFGHKLFRGNRVTKVSSDSLNAFDSPNLAPLATMGINIQVDYGNVWRPRDISPFNLHTNLDRNVSLLRIFPSITLETVKVYLQAPTQGVVLQTYGAGNFPTNRTDLLDELRSASERGVLIVNCTQCGHGSVSAIYETGALLLEAGVIPGWDMTPESALCKLSYVLGRTDWNTEKKREMLITSLRGELTKIHSKPAQFVGSNRGSYASTPTGDFYQNNAESPNFAQQFGLDVVQTIVKVVASRFGMSTPEEIDGVKKILAPSLSCALVAQCSKMEYSDEAYEKNLDDIFGNSETEISTPDYSGRTALHYAASLGDDRTLEYLLKHGASVHARDNRGFSPLCDAIEFDRHEVINILRKCGAHLTQEPTALGAELCLAASKGATLRLRSYELAGANMNQADPCGRTALHAAVESRNATSVEWLLRREVSKDVKNVFGQTPLEIAKLLKCQEIVSLLEH